MQHLHCLIEVHHNQEKELVLIFFSTVAKQVLHVHSSGMQNAPVSQRIIRFHQKQLYKLLFYKFKLHTVLAPTIFKLR